MVCQAPRAFRVGKVQLCRPGAGGSECLSECDTGGDDSVVQRHMTACFKVDWWSSQSHHAESCACSGGAACDDRCESSAVDAVRKEERQHCESEKELLWSGTLRPNPKSSNEVMISCRGCTDDKEMTGERQLYLPRCKKKRCSKFPCFIFSTHWENAAWAMMISCRGFLMPWSCIWRLPPRAREEEPQLQWPTGGTTPGQRERQQGPDSCAQLLAFRLDWPCTHWWWPVMESWEGLRPSMNTSYEVRRSTTWSPYHRCLCLCCKHHCGIIVDGDWEERDHSKKNSDRPLPGQAPQWIAFFQP